MTNILARLGSAFGANALLCQLAAKEIKNDRKTIAELEAENRLLRNTGVAQQESIEKLEAVLKRIANPPDHIPSATAHSLWSIEVAQAALDKGDSDGG